MQLGDTQSTATIQAKETKKAKGTEYVVLELRLIADQGAGKIESWVEIGTGKATTSDRAIEQIIGNKSLDEGTFVAVPARSWKPAPFAPETVTRYKRKSA